MFQVQTTSDLLWSDPTPTFLGRMYQDQAGTDLSWSYVSGSTGTDLSGSLDSGSNQY